MFYILLGLLILFLLSSEKEHHNHVYKQMKNNGMNEKELKTFVILEDKLVSSSNLVEATLLSNKIKETFPNYNFSYHTTYLKRIAEPLKFQNTY